MLSDAGGLKVAGSDVVYAPFGEVRSGEQPAMLAGLLVVVHFGRYCYAHFRALFNSRDSSYAQHLRQFLQGNADRTGRCFETKEGVPAVAEKRRQQMLH